MPVGGTVGGAVDETPVAVTPCVRLRLEQVTIDRSAGFGAMLETIDAPVVELSYDYGGQRISACDPRDRFFRATAGGVRGVPRNFEAETRARCLLESFGAVDLECLEDYAVPPDSRAHYLLRCEGDVHDYCGFSAAIVPRLRELGWHVEIDSSYPYQVVEDESVAYYASVEPDDERPDWFGLELGVELGGRRVNLLPALIDLLDGSGDGGTLASLTTYKRCVAVPLPDGRYLPVPPEQIQALLRVLSELYEGEELGEDEILAFPRGKAGALPRLDEVFVESEVELSWEGEREIREVGEVLTSTPMVRVNAPSGLKATLRSYQHEGLEWLQHLRACEVGGILADDMGLGKTLQTIAHLAAEKESGRLELPALVVAPTSLVGVWEREIAKFAPHLSTLIVHGPKRHERFEDIPTADVVITSYPLLVRDEARFLERDYHLLILDEAHTIKNTRSQAHRAAKRMRANHRLCITGTPVENHLGELWALFDFLNPGLLGDELSFRRWYRIPIRAARRRGADGDAPPAAQPLHPAPAQAGGGHRAAAQDRAAAPGGAHRQAARALREHPRGRARRGPPAHREEGAGRLDGADPRRADQAPAGLLRSAAGADAGGARRDAARRSTSSSSSSSRGSSGAATACWCSASSRGCCGSSPAVSRSATSAS